MIVERVTCDLPPGDAANTWPFTLAPVRQLASGGMRFRSAVTFLVGENGSGKSTLVEAISEGYGLDARGGRSGRKYGNDRPKTALGERVRLDMTAAGLRQAGRRRKGYFLRAETAFGFMEAVTGLPGYWQDDVTTMSHGEGFLTVLDAMFAHPGLYVMDEPEAALSFTSCLRLLALMGRLAQTGAQVVCATHSPLLCALPGAVILELGDRGFREVGWDDLEIVDHWRRYLDNPHVYLRHLSPRA